MLTKCITLKERSIWQHEPIIVLTINNHIREPKNWKKVQSPYTLPNTKTPGMRCIVQGETKLGHKVKRDETLVEAHNILHGKTIKKSNGSSQWFKVNHITYY